MPRPLIYAPDGRPARGKDPEAGFIAPIHVAKTKVTNDLSLQAWKNAQQQKESLTGGRAV